MDIPDAGTIRISGLVEGRDRVYCCNCFKVCTLFEDARLTYSAKLRRKLLLAGTG